MSRVKNSIYWLVLLLFLYGILEGAAWISYRVLFHESFSFHQVTEEIAKTSADTALDRKKTGKTPTYLLHPYYGYILNPNWLEEYRRAKGTDAGLLKIEDPLNSHGFFGAISPIQQANTEQFVVAITGGSVATYAAAWARKEFVAGLGRIEALKGREIVLLNLGQAAYKQPQQIMVIGDILSQGGKIDLLINLDGFNEIALARGHDAFGSGVSPFFPQSWRSTSETDFSRDALANFGRISLIQEKRAKWATVAADTPWQYSISASTVWRFTDSLLKKQKAALEHDLEHSSESRTFAGPVPTTVDKRTSFGPPHQLQDARQLYEAVASHWARSSVLLNNMVASQNGLYVHLLQPNQYFPGSRPPGADDEKLVHDTASPYKPEVERGYPYLRSAGRGLTQSGIHFHDLTALFKNDPDPVYRDTCCHFTEEGNIKLVRAILALIAEDVALRATPRLATIPFFDFRIDTLRALAFDSKGYRDGGGDALQQPASVER